MNKEFQPDPEFKPWGPFIESETYVVQPVTYSAIIIAGVIFGLTGIFALLAGFIGIGQTKAARTPWKSAYVWMIWLELAASVVIAIECLLFLLKIIRPSFYFYMSILLNWSIQVQLLLQIIINRIRVILHDKQQGRRILFGTAVIVTLINISVFCIWMPAQLQISERWIRINSIWDRTEKCLYLLIDALLNAFFIRVVQRNLVESGLQKYNQLVRFNKRIIVVSLLMDVMIITAMSIPNGFVYAIFHPLAYLVKLNIEMSMAMLIRKIALASSHGANNVTFIYEFAARSTNSSTNSDTEALNDGFLDSEYCNSLPTRASRENRYVNDGSIEPGLEANQAIYSNDEIQKKIQGRKRSSLSDDIAKASILDMDGERPVRRQEW